MISDTAHPSGCHCAATRGKIPKFIPNICAYAQDCHVCTRCESLHLLVSLDTQDEPRSGKRPFNPKVPGSRPGRPTNKEFWREVNLQNLLNPPNTPPCANRTCP